MVIRNPPRPRIDVQVFVELTVLSKAAQLGVAVAAAQTPVASTRASVVLKHLHLVAGVTQLIGGGHTSHAGAQDQHGSAARRALQIDRTLIGRLGRKTQAAHGLVHRRTAGAHADHAQQLAAAQRGGTGIVVHLHSSMVL